MSATEKKEQRKKLSRDDDVVKIIRLECCSLLTFRTDVVPVRIRRNMYDS